MEVNIETEEAGVYDTYIDLHNKYNERYGKACILFQCGSFFEIYGWEDEKEKRGDIYTIAEAAGNLAVASKTNGWLMAGFGPVYLDKYAPLLVENGYTVVIIEQVTPPPRPKRAITRIISPSTYLDDINLGTNNRNKNKVLLNVLFEYSKTDALIAISMAAMELSLGKSTLYTVTNSYAHDQEKCVDECFRFIHSMNPIEILFYTEKEQHIPLLQAKIGEMGILCKTHVKCVPKEFTKLSYQQEFLSKFYPQNGMLQAIPYLGLTKEPGLVITFCLLIQFAYEHDETITKELHLPIFWDHTKYLTIENNGMYQLNVTKTHHIQRSLIDLLDHTGTSIGKRLHTERLLNPVVNSDILQRRYDQIEWMLPKQKEFGESLKKVLDIERLHRKIENGTIQPHHFMVLDRSYEEILHVMTLFGSYSREEGLFPFWSESMYEEFLTWREAYRGIFQLKECQKYRLNNIKGSLFHRGIDQIVDDLQDKLLEYSSQVQSVASLLSNSIKAHVTVFSRGKKKTSKEDEEESGTEFIKIERNDRDGYYFNTSNKRAELVKKYGEPALVKIGWKGEGMKYSKQSTSTKITHDQLSKLNTQIEKCEEQLLERCGQLFLTKVQELYQTHKKIFHGTVEFISEIDWITSCAISATAYGYCKPVIDKTVDGSSFIKAKDMRHPMIERILQSTHYVPNDIELGTKDQKGMLLFGTNSSGKSSMMKSVGLTVIMAQSGMYVPCRELTYSPYQNILTRITGEDNFSKGFSSFVVEMTELRTILNRSSPTSLILGDEICHGTEQVSALAIVASSIMELSKKNANFIFATHLHTLSKMDEINGLSNVKTWHLKVLYEEEKDCLMYDRRLERGAGSDRYGLEVAKYIIQEQPEFIQQCLAIRRKILEIPQELVSKRTSKYNAKLVVDKCKICGKGADDTHHINFQCTADTDGAIQRDGISFHKNVAANLVALCKTCHVKVHHSVDNKKYIIDGYVQTSKGTILQWNEIDC